MVKPCNDCGIKGIYEGCEDQCIMYRKWIIDRDIRADERDRIRELLVKSLDTRALKVYDECIEQLKGQKND